MSSRSLRLAALALVVLATALASPAEAGAQLSWSSPENAQTFSPAENNVTNVDVATDAAGNAIAVWLQLDTITNRTRVWWARRGPGQNFPVTTPGSPPPPGAATALSEADTDAMRPRVAMNARGDAIVTWDRIRPGSGTPGSLEVRYALRPAGGSFAVAADSASRGGNSALDADVALDNQGNAVIAYVREGASGLPRRVHAAFRAAGAAEFTPPRTVSEPVAIPDDVSPSLAMDPAGNALVTWQALYGANDNRVEASYRPAGDRGTASFDTKETLSAPGEQGIDPVPAFDPAGNAAVVYTRFITAAQTYDIRAASRPKSGPFGASQTISATNPAWQPIEQPAVAFDPFGNAIAVWRQQTSGMRIDPVIARVMSATRPAGGAFGAPAPISPDGSRATRPRIAVDGQGRAAALWRAAPDAAVDDESVQAASRGVGVSGAFGPTATLVDPGELAPSFSGQKPGGGDPRLAVSAGGQAVATWSRYGGTAFAGQAAFGTPPGQTPPPPPPPPPPAPNPSAIQPAEPFERGKAIVLEVRVDGVVTSLRWEFSDGNPAVTAGPVNGRVPRSIRLRPTTRSFKATVRAYGPGGSRSYSRTFTVPKPLTDRNTQNVEAEISSARPPVLAIGEAATLTGRSNACGPLTIVSAKQTVEGCFKPVEALSDVPAAERGFIAPLAKELRLDPSDAPLVKAALTRLDGYVSQGRAEIGGRWPVVPKGSADVVSFPQARLLTSSNASLEVGGFKFGASSKGFALDFDPRKATIPLGSLPKPPKLPTIGGFELVGGWDIKLEQREAVIKASLKLPKFITKAGVRIQNSVTLRATPERVIVDNVSVGPIDANVGALDVEAFKIAYDRPDDVWAGQGKVCLLSGVCIDMAPPNGGVKVKHQTLNFAGASVNFPLPGVPLFTGVNLERIGFGLGLDPTRMTGNARIAVLEIAKLDGRVVVAFPSTRTPFLLRADEVGGGFPPSLYQEQYTRTTLGATAGLEVAIPVIGDLKLASGYFLYQTPNYIALGGAADVTLLDLIQLRGSLGGELNTRQRAADFHGDIQGCLLVVKRICGGAVAHVSRAPGNGGGAALCIQLGPVSVGGGVHWNDISDPSIWPLDGCKWSPFRVTVQRASAAQAAGSYEMVVKRGGPSPVLRLSGSGGAPRVRVTGPGGQALESTDAGLDASPDDKIRILRFESRYANVTTVGLQDARPGTYVVAALEGSPPIASVARATDQPDAKVTARVTGRDRHRVLEYRVPRRARQKVSFQEIDKGGGAKTIGIVNGGGHGKLRFSPAPGRGLRRIEAQFELDGLPAERRTVARFRPPSPTLRKPRGLSVKRKRRSPKLTIRWRRVSGAARYEVAVTARSGRQRFKTTKRRRLTIAMPRSAGGRVTVRAVDQLRQSLPAGRPFKATARPRRAFHRLGRCKVVKRKAKKGRKTTAIRCRRT